MPPRAFPGPGVVSLGGPAAAAAAMRRRGFDAHETLHFRDPTSPLALCRGPRAAARCADSARFRSRFASVVRPPDRNTPWLDAGPRPSSRRRVLCGPRSHSSAVSAARWFGSSRAFRIPLAGDFDRAAAPLGGPRSRLRGATSQPPSQLHPTVGDAAFNIPAAAAMVGPLGSRQRPPHLARALADGWPRRATRRCRTGSTAQQGPLGVLAKAAMRSLAWRQRALRANPATHRAHSSQSRTTRSLTLGERCA